jgi:hypothetical protein
VYKRLLSHSLAALNPNLKVLLSIIALPFVVLISALFYPVIKYLEFRDRKELKRFCKEHFGKTYFIPNRKRGWYEFIKNNIEPVLSESIEINWEKSFKSTVLNHLNTQKTFYIASPFAVVVEQSCLNLLPLHSALQSLKSNPKKSTQTQISCKEIIAQALNTSGSS